MPTEPTPEVIEGSRPMAEMPLLCLRSAQWLLAGICVCDFFAWIGSAAIWLFLAYLGLCLVLALACGATCVVAARTIRSRELHLSRRLVGFYVAAALVFLNLILRSGAAPAVGPLVLAALSLLTFVLLLWAGNDQALADGLNASVAAPRGKDTEPPTGVY